MQPREHFQLLLAKAAQDEYTLDVLLLHPTGSTRSAWSAWAFDVSLSEDEVDLDSGFVMVPGAVPEPETPPAPLASRASLSLSVRTPRRMRACQARSK